MNDNNNNNNNNHKSRSMLHAQIAHLNETKAKNQGGVTSALEYTKIFN